MIAVTLVEEVSLGVAVGVGTGIVVAVLIVAVRGFRANITIRKNGS